MSVLPRLADHSSSPSARHVALLHTLPQIAQSHTDAQIDKLRFQLADALLKLSETSDRPAEEQAAFNAYNLLRNHGPRFGKLLSAAIGRQCANALRDLEQGRPAIAAVPSQTESFEDMEDRMLEDEVRFSVEQHVGVALEALNLRIAALLARDRIDTEINPWRPLLFVQAICQTWNEIDGERATRRVMLSRLGPQLFFRLDAIYAAMNATLIENDVLPDVKAVARAIKRTQPALPFAATTSPALMARGERYNRVRDWLLSGGKKPAQSDDAEHLNLPDLFGAQDSSGNWQANTISVAVGPQLFSHLTRLQMQLEQGEQTREVPTSAAVLRHIGAGLPEGSLGAVDKNTVELLARIFDQLLASPDIAPPVKALLARLQVPMLKCSLMDRKFFIKAEQPARRLFDLFIAGGAAVDDDGDPLLRQLAKIVERVTNEFDQKTKILTELADQLELWLANQERNAAAIPETRIKEALRAEKMHLAELAARADINQRLETGAVPQFVEEFLETRWLKILTICHGGRDKKPELLERALKAMDDLIATLQPPIGPTGRDALLRNLPPTIANVNAWLDAIKWEGTERGRFFAMLAERHASLIRLHGIGGNPRVEAAVAMAHRASERNLARERRSKVVAAQHRRSHAANLRLGDWLDLPGEDGKRQRLRLAWISPRNTQFVFADRNVFKTMVWSEPQLDYALRQGEVRRISLVRAVDRALDTILNEPASASSAIGVAASAHR